jgi:hypothetical protein
MIRGLPVHKLEAGTAARVALHALVRRWVQPTEQHAQVHSSTISEQVGRGGCCVFRAYQDLADSA